MSGIFVDNTVRFFLFSFTNWKWIIYIEYELRRRERVSTIWPTLQLNSVWTTGAMQMKAALIAYWKRVQLVFVSVQINSFDNNSFFEIITSSRCTWDVFGSNTSASALSAKLKYLGKSSWLLFLSAFTSFPSFCCLSPQCCRQADLSRLKWTASGNFNNKGRNASKKRWKNKRKKLQWSTKCLWGCTAAEMNKQPAKKQTNAVVETPILVS